MIGNTLPALIRLVNRFFKKFARDFSHFIYESFMTFYDKKGRKRTQPFVYISESLGIHEILVTLFSKEDLRTS